MHRNANRAAICIVFHTLFPSKEMDEFLLLSAICSGDLKNFSDVGLCGGVPLFGTTTTWALNWRISWSFNFKIFRASSSSLVKLNLFQVSTSLKKVIVLVLLEQWWVNYEWIIVKKNMSELLSKRKIKSKRYFYY